MVRPAQAREQVGGQAAAATETSIRKRHGNCRYGSGGVADQTGIDAAVVMKSAKPIAASQNTRSQSSAGQPPIPDRHRPCIRSPR